MPSTTAPTRSAPAPSGRTAAVSGSSGPRGPGSSTSAAAALGELLPGGLQRDGQDTGHPAVRADDRAVREGEVTLLRVTVPVQDLQLVVEAQRDTLVEYPLEPRL